MYVLLEFLRGRRKEYAVVPIIWLYNDNKECYWPRVKPEEFMRLVKEKSPYDKRWPKYKINRVMKSSDAYDSLQQELTEILEQSTTDSGNSATQIAIITDEPSHDQEIVSESDGSPKITRKHISKVKTQKRKHKNKKRENKKSRSTKSRSPKKKQPSSSSSSPTSETDDVENCSMHDETEFQSNNRKSSTQLNRESPPDIRPPRSSATPKIISITNMESLHSSNVSSPRFPALHRNITGMEPLLSSPNHVPPSRSPAILRNITNTEPVASSSKYTSPPRSPTTPRSITNMETLASISKYAYLPRSPATPRSITNTEPLASSSKYTSPPRSPTTPRSISNTERSGSSSKHAPPSGSLATPKRIINMVPNASVFRIDHPPTTRQSSDERSSSWQSPLSSRLYKFKNLSQEQFQTEILTRLQTIDSELSQLYNPMVSLSCHWILWKTSAVLTCC